MDKADKTTELLQLISECPYADGKKVGKDDRTYDLQGRYVRFHDVSTDGKFYGFVAIQIPNPADDYDTQLESLMDIYTTERIVKGCLKSIVIEGQSAARKVATDGVKKMPDAEFASAWDNLDPDVAGRLKTYEYIAKHIRDTWLKNQADTVDGQYRLF